MHALRQNKSSKNIDEGIALLHAARDPNHSYSLREIARAAGCSSENIRLIERRALRKLRAGLKGV